jgi:ariadne-1
MALEKMKLLQDLKGAGLNDVQFLYNAVDAVIECRRVLQWTYCFGYFLSNGKEKDLFEMLQEDLEKHVETLHEFSEKPIEELISNDMKAHINNLTRVTRTVSIRVSIL